MNRPLLESLLGDVDDVRAGDLDGDGDGLARSFGREPIVLENGGGGASSCSTTDVPHVPRPDTAPFLEDVEENGDLDRFLVGFDGGADHALVLNDGNGFFTRAIRGEPHGTSAAYRATIGDIDGDGTKDILQRTVNGPNRMWWALE